MAASLLSFVNFLLEECFDDIEQPSILDAEDRYSRVTSLWCAAVDNNLDGVDAVKTPAAACQLNSRYRSAVSKNNHCSIE